MILSNEYTNKLLDLIRGYDITAPSKFYIGIVQTDGNEVSGASYARVEYDATNIAWYSTQETVNETSTGTSRTIKPVANISWGTALENWGTVNRIRFYLSASGTDYFGDVIITNLTINNGDTIEILSGDFNISIPNDN